MMERKIITLHNWEVSPLKKDELKVRSVLKAMITDRLEETFKLSEKSFGYQYLILLGTGVIDTKGHSTGKQFK